MRILLLLLLFLTTESFAQTSRIVTDKKQAKVAFELLNAIRSNPHKYARELGLSNVKTVNRTKLIWNDKLAKAAEFRAYDMAKRSYFDHITPEGFGPNYYIAKAGYRLNKDWLKDISANNFESIAGNHPSAEAGIKAFIIGKGSPGFMHRKHVLGMDPWNSSLVDIGIGFTTVPHGSLYKSYLVVIIAKHDW